MKRIVPTSPSCNRTAVRRSNRNPSLPEGKPIPPTATTSTRERRVATDGTQTCDQNSASITRDGKLNAESPLSKRKLNVTKSKYFKTEAEAKKVVEEDKKEEYLPWMPDDWLTVLDNIRSMRSKNDAPVDIIGCDKLADSTADAKTQRFHILIALMLSSQTKDAVTAAAMARLKECGLTPVSMVSTGDETLGELISPVGFWRKKVCYIKQSSRILIDEYSGDIPGTLPGLLALPGVGPKMAHLCMRCGWGEVTGIAVDIHVHRIANRLGWVRTPTRSPTDTQKQLEAWVPRPLWSQLNNLLVGFGQTVCSAAKPSCDVCLNLSLCPYAKLSKKPMSKKKRNM